MGKISFGFWVGFIVFVLLMLLLDLFVFHKKDKEIKLKDALLTSLFWIVLALLFDLGIFFVAGHLQDFETGKQKALEFLTGYLLEESLSVDNLFVFIAIFGYFNIAPKYQHKILFWGIIGAIIMRAVFIFTGVALIKRFDWVMYIFGLILFYSGIHLLFEKKENEDFDPEKNIVIRFFKKVFPVTHETDMGFFVKKGNIIYATSLFVTLLLIEVSDLLFAVDSIPAVLSVSKDVFIIYSSNIFAILGLRSLYFAINGIVDYFHFLKYALSGILTFIGAKMIINEYSDTFEISNTVSLYVIISLLSLSIVASVIDKKRIGRKSQN